MESSVTTKIKGVTKSQLDPGSEFDPGELQKTEMGNLVRNFPREFQTRQTRPSTPTFLLCATKGGEKFFTHALDFFASLFVAQMRRDHRSSSFCAEGRRRIGSWIRQTFLQSTDLAKVDC